MTTGAKPIMIGGSGKPTKGLTCSESREVVPLANGASWFIFFPRCTGCSPERVILSHKRAACDVRKAWGRQGDGKRPPRGFVKISAKLSWDGICMKSITAMAKHSRMRWKAQALCFFLSCELGMDVEIMTALLAPHIIVVPSTSTPNMRRAYRYSKTSLAANFPATISDLYVEVSTVFCLLETQRTGVLLMKRMMPVRIF
jgi:hypothetical protein